MPRPSMVLSVQVVLDVGDIARAATCWGALLDQEPDPPRSKGTLVTVGALPGTTWLVLQHVPASKTVKNRVHLDLTVADVDAAVNRILALGGQQVREVREGGGHFVTMADHDGNALCVAAYARSRTGERMPAIPPPVDPSVCCVGFSVQRVRRTLPAPQHNTGTHAEAVPQHTGHAQTEKTQDRRPAPRSTPPNKGVELTASSVRSSLAPASSSSSRLALGTKHENHKRFRQVVRTAQRWYSGLSSVLTPIVDAPAQRWIPGHRRYSGPASVLRPSVGFRPIVGAPAQRRYSGLSSVPRQKTEDRRPASRYTRPNKGVQATANKLRSFLAPLVGRA